MIACKDNLCKFYRGTQKAHWPNPGAHYCKAFPDGIPEAILNGTQSHLEPIKGQRGEMIFSRGTNPTIIKPYLARDMLDRKLHGHDNLCATIRDIYIKSDDLEIKFWCKMAMRMSKNTHKALEKYKQMLLELGADVRSDTRDDWQLGKKG